MLSCSLRCSNRNTYRFFASLLLLPLSRQHQTWWLASTAWKAKKKLRLFYVHVKNSKDGVKRLLKAIKTSRISTTSDWIVKIVYFIYDINHTFWSIKFHWRQVIALNQLTWGCASNLKDWWFSTYLQMSHFYHIILSLVVGYSIAEVCSDRMNVCGHQLRKILSDK